MPFRCAACCLPPTLRASPRVSKEFNPDIINPGGNSTLTITFSNPDSSGAILIGAFTDTLPNGVVVAPIPNVGTTCTDVGAPVAVAGGSTVTLPGGRSIPANGSCTLTVDVSAASAGTYINTIPANTLFTSNGNNAAPAIATLNVVATIPPPTLAKAFSPSTINAGGVSTLTVTLSNPNLAVATLTAPLTDTLPSGVVIAPDTQCQHHLWRCWRAGGGCRRRDGNACRPDVRSRQRQLHPDRGCDCGGWRSHTSTRSPAPW